MKNLLTFITSLCFSVQIFSQSCSIYGGEVIFEDATINGTVITNPQSPVSINVHYMFPTEDIEQITTQIRQLKILMDSIKRENLSIQQQTKILKQKEANLRKIQQKVDEDRKGIVSESENIKEAKLKFEKEVRLAKKEFEEATSLISPNQTEEPIAQRLNELKARGEKIIESTENCLLNDFNVIQIKDIQTGI